MSNLVCVQFTSFQNLDSEGKPSGKSCLGYRIYDDYDGDYNNSFESIDEMLQAGLTPEGIFDYILEHHDSYWEEATNRGILFNDQYLPPPGEVDQP